MKREKCSVCGKPACAYRLEADRSRIYLCLDHLPVGEAPHLLDEKPEDVLRP